MKISFSFDVLYVFCFESKTIHKITSFYDNNGKNIEIIYASIPDYPVISFSSDKNYITIVQQQSCSLGKTTILLTKIAINENNETTQSIIEIDNNNDQFEITNVLFDKSFMFILRNGSPTYEKWMNENQSFKKVLSINTYIPSQSKQKIDFNSYFSILEPIQNNEKFGVSIYSSSIFFTEDTELFIQYPLLLYTR